MGIHTFSNQLGMNAQVVASSKSVIGAVRPATLYEVDCHNRLTGKLNWKAHFLNRVVDEGLDDILDKRFLSSGFTSSDFVSLINEVATSSITGISQADPGVVLTPSTTGLSNGDVVRINNVVGMVEVNGLEFIVANIVVDTSFEIVDTTGFTAYTSGGNWWKNPVIAGDTAASHAGWTENTAYSEATRPVLTLAAVSGQSTTNAASKAVFTGDTAGQLITGLFVITDNTKGGATGIIYGGGVFVEGTKPFGLSDIINATVTLSTSATPI